MRYKNNDHQSSMPGCIHYQCCYWKLCIKSSFQFFDHHEVATKENHHYSTPNAKVMLLKSHPPCTGQQSLAACCRYPHHLMPSPPELQCALNTHNNTYTWMSGMVIRAQRHLRMSSPCSTTMREMLFIISCSCSMFD